MKIWKDASDLIKGIKFNVAVQVVKKLGNDKAFVEKINILESAYKTGLLDRFKRTIDKQVEFGNTRAIIEGRALQSRGEKLSENEKLETMEMVDELLDIVIAIKRYVELYGQLVA